jgi:hypothetical protein
MDFSSHSILWVLVIGLVVGAIAKLLMPGKDPVAFIVWLRERTRRGGAETCHGRRRSLGHCYPALCTNAANLRTFERISDALQCTDLPMKTAFAQCVLTLV